MRDYYDRDRTIEIDLDDEPNDPYDACNDRYADDDDDEGICPSCSGSGEGMYEGQTCSRCKGKGIS